MSDDWERDSNGNLVASTVLGLDVLSVDGYLLVQLKTATGQKHFEAVKAGAQRPVIVQVAFEAEQAESLGALLSFAADKLKPKH